MNTYIQEAMEDKAKTKNLCGHTIFLEMHVAGTYNYANHNLKHVV
jgi:hypothetical protein